MGDEKEKSRADVIIDQLGKLDTDLTNVGSASKSLEAPRVFPPNVRSVEKRFEDAYNKRDSSALESVNRRVEGIIKNRQEQVELFLKNFSLMARASSWSICDQIVELFKEEPEFSFALTSAFFEAGVLLTSKPDQVSPLPPIANLPEKAPRLWADRSGEERNIDPAAFIRKVYAQWLDQGLTRAHVRQLDPALYVSYAQWIRPERHPGDAIVFAPSHLFNAYADPVEATEHRRRLAREARARQRSKAKADKMSHNTLSHDKQ